MLDRNTEPSPFGPDPADADFGARVLDVPSNAPDIELRLGGPFGPATDLVVNEVTALRLHHNGGNYLAGASLDATAAISTEGSSRWKRMRGGRTTVATAATIEARILPGREL